MDGILQMPIPPPGSAGIGNVVALDFETANSARCSPCSIGLAWLNGRGIAHTAHRLICPRDLRFDAFNISLHGICEDHVRGEPEFPGVWNDILPHLQGGITIAHNASFDMSVLRATLDLYGLPWPDISYLCSMKIAREVWGNLPNHKLPTVARHIGHDLHHHQAWSDAEVCIAIVVAAMDAVGAASVTELANRLCIRIGRIAEGSYNPCSSPSRKPSASGAQPPEYLIEIIQRAGSSDLRGKTVVFTGTLETMLRSEAVAVVEAVGGVWQRGVKRDTDYLVVGTDPGGGKLAKAARQMDKMGRPELVDESDFLRMVGL